MLLNLDPLLAIAVSGGRDSMALLHMAYAQFGASNIVALTIDHGLRPESAAEAAMVQQWCLTHGIAHHILTWQKAPDTKLSQATARHARYNLLADWCFANNIFNLCTGHTANDVAETFWARLQRGGDLSNLSAMPTTRLLKSFYAWPCDVSAPHATSIMLHRPLFHLSRVQTTNYCAQHHVPYINDPSNENLNFERVQHRTFLNHMASERPHFIKALIANAQTLRVADNALQAQSTNLWQQYVVVHHTYGCASMPQAVWQAQSAEQQYRLLKMLIWQVRGHKALQLSQALRQQLPQLQQGQNICVGGCVILYYQNHIFVCREDRFLPSPLILTAGLNIYDDRWLIYCPPILAGIKLAALGEAAWRKQQVPQIQNLPSLANYTQLGVWQHGVATALPTGIKYQLKAFDTLTA